MCRRSWGLTLQLIPRTSGFSMRAHSPTSRLDPTRTPESIKDSRSSNRASACPSSPACASSNRRILNGRTGMLHQAPRQWEDQNQLRPVERGKDFTYGRMERHQSDDLNDGGRRKQFQKTKVMIGDEDLG